MSKPIVTLAVVASLAVGGCGSNGAETKAKTKTTACELHGEQSAACAQQKKVERSINKIARDAEQEEAGKRAKAARCSLHPTEPGCDPKAEAEKAEQEQQEKEPAGESAVEEAAKKRHESPEGQAAIKRATEENEAATEGERLKE
jgi:hypothetical protein